MREEIENWVELGFNVGGEDLRAHAKNPRQVLLVDAFGLEEENDGVNGMQGGSVERRVKGECFT